MECSTSVLTLAPGANGKAYLVVWGLAPDSYFGSFFVLTTSGTPISTTATTSFSV